VKKVYVIGNKEKHQLEFNTNWLLGLVTVKFDKKVLARKSLLFKMDMSFEIGDQEKHLLAFTFNLFNYGESVMHVTIDGQDIPPEKELVEEEVRIDTPVDDAGAAFFYMAFINTLFAVIGTLFVPDLDSLQVRIMLLIGAFAYLLFGIQCIRYHKMGFLAGCLFFLVDSAFFLFYQFSWGGLCVRGIIVYYLFIGIMFWSKTDIQKTKGFRAQPSV